MKPGGPQGVPANTRAPSLPIASEDPGACVQRGWELVEAPKEVKSGEVGRAGRQPCRGRKPGPAFRGRGTDPSFRFDVSCPTGGQERRLMRLALGSAHGACRVEKSVSPTRVVLGRLAARVGTPERPG